ncbi:DEAD/DEAH box helicase family protein [Mesonia mobilis]|uniref:DEAD/DEAH box helicase family protein n=1 Tax=Mesonia mobilis TaxID=369791 RepID=UPI0026EFE09F|nr:DEAD/DEAH box helicase family protein [Mesonia mobilis]
MKKFKQIKFPPSYKYSSDSEHIPLEFYEETFPLAKNIDLLLGYFSTNAIKVLSKSFAEFIYNGGKLRLITNHLYSSSDYENLIKNVELNNEDQIINIFSDLSEIEKNLGQTGVHFFDCLKYLLKQGRLEIIPVKFNQVNLAHCKKMILYDGVNHILTEGSINFTLPALLKNSESFQVETPWNGEVSQNRIKEEKENFDKIFQREHKSYKYLDKDQIEVVINSVGRDKDISDLLDDSLKLPDDEYSTKVKAILNKKKKRFEEQIELIKSKPKFPFDEPRAYQLNAYQNWVKNNYQGIFAMATGTGKTVTSLNCILQEYKKSHKYKFIVLVPTLALVDQWEKEIQTEFNFQNLISIKSKYFYQELKYDDKEENSCIILTYATFKGKKFQEKLRGFRHLNTFTLIADECHNMGSKGFLSVIDSLSIINKRIGLSATPSRYFDELGEKEVFNFFNVPIKNDVPKYTFSFSISEAINAQPTPYLCPYNYNIKFVELEKYELDEYRKYTKKLARYIDKEGKLKKSIEVEKILKLRKDIIKKAKNKKSTLIQIINEIGLNNFKYSFVYVPEGKEKDYSENHSDWNQYDQSDLNLIADYTLAINDKFDNKIPISHFTGATKERNNILENFEKGHISALFAMKCLDEGVDIPRTEIAIFCSSTGNPRQYVQRRGRVLRLHEKKEIATIYDMIVIPSSSTSSEAEYNCEKGLVEGELRRLMEFAKDSKNLDKTLNNQQLITIADHYKINLYNYLNN